MPHHDQTETSVRQPVTKRRAWRRDPSGPRTQRLRGLRDVDSRAHSWRVCSNCTVRPWGSSGGNMGAETGGVEYAVSCVNRWFAFTNPACYHQGPIREHRPHVWKALLHQIKSSGPRLDTWPSVVPDQHYTGNQGKWFIHTKRGQHLHSRKATFTGSTFHNNLSPCCQGDNGGFMCNIYHEMDSFTLAEELSFFSETALKDLPSFPLRSVFHKSGIKPSLRADLTADLCEHTNDKIWTKGKLRPDGCWQAPPCGSGELCAEKGWGRRGRRPSLHPPRWTLAIPEDHRNWIGKEKKKTLS